MSAALARRCAGCGATVADDAPYPFRCPAADSGDGRDHVLGDADEISRVPPGGRVGSIPFSPDPGSVQPFVRYRRGLWSYAAARARGMSDGQWIEMAKSLDDAVAAVDGCGFRVTPLAPADRLGARLGRTAGSVWVKDETGNVSGSHKGRHLFGLALALEVAERTGRATRAETDRRGLAIASCGNAALAAAVVARAGRRPLRVFIPADAEPAVVARLRALEAGVVVCPREPGVPGDPCLRAFHDAVRQGALPFCCQGSENGLAIEGGMTLAWEMMEALDDRRVRLDRLFVQVGGGALAAACTRAFRRASAGGAGGMPRLHPVQTEGAWPLRRAWEALRARLAPGEPGDAGAADAMAAPERAAARADAMRYARNHRGEFMRPWETTPHSLAHGILDDETYDWAEVIEGTLESGGWPVVASEARVREAWAMARETTGIPVDATGSAGLAGLIAFADRGDAGTVGLLFTGVERPAPPAGL